MGIRRPRFARGGGGVTLRATARAFLTTDAQGLVLASLTRPFGTGTVFTTVGAVPAQLGLVGGNIVRGAGAADGEQSYTIRIRAAAADNSRAIEANVTLLAVAPIVISGAPADAIVGQPYEHIFTANGAVSIAGTDLTELGRYNLRWDAAARRLWSPAVQAG